LEGDSQEAQFRSGSISALVLCQEAGTSKGMCAHYWRIMTTCLCIKGEKPWDSHKGMVSSIKLNEYPVISVLHEQMVFKFLAAFPMRKIIMKSRLASFKQAKT
jgi:hypothetical protein